jgi:putative spermidine/putrescine transport system permease protein
VVDMTATGAAPSSPLRTKDGTPLRLALARVQARARLRAALLVLPLLIFVVVTFVYPIGELLWRSVYNPAFSANMPRLVAWFEATPVGTEPDESAFEALALDLKDAAEARTVAIAGTRVNYDLEGSRSLFTATGRKAKSLAPPYREALVALDPKWAAPELWMAMRQAAKTHTAGFYLAALDFTRDTSGNIVRVEAERQIYVTLFLRTFALSAVIAALCLLLGYPVAHLLSVLPLRFANLLMILVLLPFWTSLLVRTTSWMVLLQSQGVVNDVLVALGIVGEDGRVQMIYNQTGTIVAMTHILLPFMILPLYSVMRTISPSYVRAARSLGASSWRAFREIYLPLTVPGIGAGVLLVFILAVGYYITPALVGGTDGTLISNMIAFHMQKSLNWSLAAALAGLLLASVLVLYWLYDRLIGIDNMKLG